MTEISVGFTIVIPGTVDPHMHFGLEVKRLSIDQAQDAAFTRLQHSTSSTMNFKLLKSVDLVRCVHGT